MKPGKSIVINRLLSGLYKISLEQNNMRMEFVGPAATTIITLVNALFKDEVAEIEKYARTASNELGDALIKDMKTNPRKYAP